MQMNVMQERLTVHETIYEGLAEHVAESDMIVPDYYPDILKIVKSSALPVIRSKRITGERLMIEGSVTFTVLYMPEKGRMLRSLTHTSNFETSINLNVYCEDAQMRVVPSLKQCVCQPINSRKMGFRALIGFSVQVFGVKEVSMLSNAANEEAGVESHKHKVKAMNILGSGEKVFKISDIVEIGQGKPPVLEILWGNATILLNDSKVIANKIILKGMAVLKTLYTPDNETAIPESMEHQIPFSQIIELEGIEEGCNCDLRFWVVSCELSAGNDGNGESRMINVNISVSIDAVAYCCEVIDILSDAYSTAYDLDIERNDIIVERLVESTTDSIAERDSLTVTTGNIHNVVDAWGTASVENVSFENNMCHLEGSATISVMCMMEDGTFECFEKRILIKWKYQFNEKLDACRASANLILDGLGYYLNSSNELEMRVQVLLDISVCKSERLSVIQSIAIDSSKPKAIAKRPVIVLYFGTQGDRLWDIAKRYNTSVKAIRAANNLDDSETLSRDTMLLIPRRR